MEWFILLLLVPAIVVPVVLLWGFAGCDLVFKIDPPPPQKPEELVATPISVSEISLTWVSMGMGLQFEVHRAVDGGSFELIATVPGPPFLDPPNFGSPTPLVPGVTYRYQVFAVNGDGPSEGSNIVEARPLAFHFDLSLPGGVDQTRDGDTIVQKISSNLLRNWGRVVKIHVRGTTTDDLKIDNIYISQVARVGTPGNPNPDSYDSDTDIAFVAAGVQVPANSSIAVDLSSIYKIPDPPQDLLIAFDINSVQGRVHFASLTGAVSSTLDANQQAAVQDRFPNAANPALTYTTIQSRIYLIEKIEVLGDGQ